MVCILTTQRQENLAYGPKNCAKTDRCDFNNNKDKMEIELTHLQICVSSGEFGQNLPEMKNSQKR